MGIVIPYEITAAGIVIGYWPNSVPIAVWMTIMIVVIIGQNFMPVKTYGEFEFWLAGTKASNLLPFIPINGVWKEKKTQKVRRF